MAHNYNSMYTYTRHDDDDMTASTATTFTLAAPDFAYLHLELRTTHDSLEMDLIGWKILITKGMAQFLGHIGESIQTDILHILNPSSATASIDINGKETKQTKFDTTPVETPQVWIRVPETELSNVWAGLSGFTTVLDTGNYGEVEVGIRVLRASRYMMAVTGPLRSKW